MYFQYDVFYTDSENRAIVVKSFSGDDEWPAIMLVEELNAKGDNKTYSYALVAKED